MSQGEIFYLTKKGIKDLEAEYQSLKKIRMMKTQNKVPEIWESEDLNPEYLSFREDLDLLEARMAELENVLKNSVIIKKPSKEKLKIVGLGATVRVKVGGEKGDFIIVGTLEANPALGKISNESPVGRALLGHKVGDEVVVSSPVKTIYKIQKVKYQ